MPRNYGAFVVAVIILLSAMCGGVVDRILIRQEHEGEIAAIRAEQASLVAAHDAKISALCAENREAAKAQQDRIVELQSILNVVDPTGEKTAKVKVEKIKESTLEAKIDLLLKSNEEVKAVTDRLLANDERICSNIRWITGKLEEIQAPSMAEDSEP